MRLVVCYPVNQEQLNQIRAVAPEIEVVDASPESVNNLLPTADLFCGHAKEVPVDWDRVVAGGRMRWIQSSAAGLDHCLVPSVINSPIIVTSAAGLFANQVAEQTLALLLGLLRSLPAFFRAQQLKDFTRLPTGDLHGKTIGIVGLGGNGRRIAELVAPFHTRILATDLYPVNRPAHVEQLWPAQKLSELLSHSDIVILCVPLNESTLGMIGPSELSAMKAGSLLINVARGPVVVESALVAALEEGHLAGAGLDVTEIEPLPPESRLWDMENVIITPHVGAQSARRVSDITDFYCENLRRYLNGEPLSNQVDKRTGVVPVVDTSPAK